jgi:hypothetical protein
VGYLWPPSDDWVIQRILCKCLVNYGNNWNTISRQATEYLKLLTAVLWTNFCMKSAKEIAARPVGVAESTDHDCARIKVRLHQTSIG